jgi:hypothetical protein
MSVTWVAKVSMTVIGVDLGCGGWSSGRKFDRGKLIFAGVGGVNQQANGDTN